VQEALVALACMTQAEAGARGGWPHWLAALAEAGRATRATTRPAQCLWVALERLACVQAAIPAPVPPRAGPATAAAAEEPGPRDDALVEICARA
jgi:ATP-dependent Lhr-like helicase